MSLKAEGLWSAAILRSFYVLPRHFASGPSALACRKAAKDRSSPKALRASRLSRKLTVVIIPRVNDDKLMRWQRVRDVLQNALAAESTREARIAAIVDAIWAEFGDHRPVSWVGYYILQGAEMILGPRRDKPACSPIGLHGACGQAALSGRSLLVRDVRELGANYIACDPRDLSELVVPVRNKEGEIAGVLDLDSYTVSAFDEDDARAIESLLAQFLPAHG